MNRRLLWIPAVYALIMGILLVATIGFSYTPISYDHTIEDNTWTAVYQGETWEVDAQEHVNEALQASLLNNRKQEQWIRDIVAIGVLLPFVLLALDKEARPFKKKVPFGIYLGLTLSIAVLYAIFSIDTHMEIHRELQATIDYLREVS